MRTTAGTASGRPVPYLDHLNSIGIGGVDFVLRSTLGCFGVSAVRARLESAIAEARRPPPAEPDVRNYRIRLLAAWVRYAYFGSGRSFGYGSGSRSKSFR